MPQTTDNRGGLKAPPPGAMPVKGGGWLRPFPKGVSGNPGGKGGPVREAEALAREASPRAVKRLIELLDSRDERVAAVAAQALLDRGLGKPKPRDQSAEKSRTTLDTSRLSDAEIRFLLDVFQRAAVQTTDEDASGAAPATVDGHATEEGQAIPAASEEEGES